MTHQRRDFRKSIGATLLDVAELVGVPEDLIQKFETGKRVPSAENDARWVEALKVLAARSAARRERARVVWPRRARVPADSQAPIPPQLW